MPDARKLAVLQEAGFRIMDTCGTCKSFVRGALMWGSCHDIPPVHLKHSAGARISAHVSGTCQRHNMREDVADDLKRSGFDRFRE